MVYSCCHLIDCTVDNVHHSGVVTSDRCWGLWVVEILEGEAHDLSFDGVEEEGAKFGFSRRCSNMFENGRQGNYCVIEVDWTTILREGTNAMSLIVLLQAVWVVR